MKRITVAIPEPALRRARGYAAERGTSVSALVRDFLTGLGRRRGDFERGLRMQQEIFAAIDAGEPGLGEFRAGDRLSRDEVHRRRGLSRTRMSCSTRSVLPPTKR